jgi:HK97 family phage prohead protease
MKLVTKFYSSDIDSLSDRQVRAVCSTGDVDRDGEVIVQAGIDLSAYLANPIVLWQHDVGSPIGKCVEIGVGGGRLMAVIEFAPLGVSDTADEVCGLVKCGVINGLSVGFMPSEREPVDPKNPRGPQKHTACELYELSFVAVPANPGAAVIERSLLPGGGAYARKMTGDFERAAFPHRATGSAGAGSREERQAIVQRLRDPDADSLDWNEYSKSLQREPAPGDPYCQQSSTHYAHAIRWWLHTGRYSIA